MANCPSGHDSTTTDYCDVCGDSIAGSPESAGPGSASETEVISAEKRETCPDCGALRTGRFCEADGHDFLMSTAPPGPQEPDALAQGPDAPGPAEPGEPATPPAWTIVITADRAYYDQVIEQTPADAAAAIAFPAQCPERVLPLTGDEIRIGRKSTSRGVVPEIDLSGPPEDPGVSHIHAMLAPGGDGDWVLVDAGSTNGTTVNGSERPVPANVDVPVSDGDRIHLGAWTTIILRKTG